MKKILLSIEDEVYKKFRNEIMIKAMCGNIYGTPDSLNVLLVKAIDEGKEECIIIPKPKEKKNVRVQSKKKNETDETAGTSGVGKSEPREH